MSDRIRIRVLDAVRAGRGEATKKSIENATGLACATVCKTVDSLLADRTIFARREAPSGRGRPALPLALNLDSALFAGLDLGGESWRILFSDLGFNRLYYRKIATPPYEGRETFFRHLFAFIRSSLAESRLDAAKLRLIGLAVSANTDPDTGVVVSAGNMGIRWGGEPAGPRGGRAGVRRSRLRHHHAGRRRLGGVQIRHRRRNRRSGHCRTGGRNRRRDHRPAPADRQPSRPSGRVHRPSLHSRQPGDLRLRLSRLSGGVCGSAFPRRHRPAAA